MGSEMCIRDRFIGYGSGVQISYCDVTNLKHTTVKEPKDLEANEAPTYYDESKSTYAVTGAKYAGGYIGYMDIGSAASVGKGLSVLGKSIGINSVLDALNVVVSTIEHSDVTGNAVSYTHLTLPTKRIVEISVVPGYIKKKKKKR